MTSLTLIATAEKRRRYSALTRPSPTLVTFLVLVVACLASRPVEDGPGARKIGQVNEKQILGLLRLHCEGRPSDQSAGHPDKSYADLSECLPVVEQMSELAKNGIILSLEANNLYIRAKQRLDGLVRKLHNSSEPTSAAGMERAFQVDIERAASLHVSSLEKIGDAMRDPLSAGRWPDLNQDKVGVEQIGAETNGQEDELDAAEETASAEAEVETNESAAAHVASFQQIGSGFRREGVEFLAKQGQDVKGEETARLNAINGNSEHVGSLEQSAVEPQIKVKDHIATKVPDLTPGEGPTRIVNQPDLAAPADNIEPDLSKGEAAMLADGLEQIEAEVRNLDVHKPVELT